MIDKKNENYSALIFIYRNGTLKEYNMSVYKYI